MPPESAAIVLYTSDVKATKLDLAEVHYSSGRDAPHPRAVAVHSKFDLTPRGKKCLLAADCGRPFFLSRP